MAELHEVLAVDRDREKQAKTVIDETRRLWNKVEKFMSHHTILKMADENRQHEEAAHEQKTEMVTTVPKRLKHTHGYIVNWFDSLAQKEATNQLAIADVTDDDGNVILKDIPGPLLLTIEKHLVGLLDLYKGIPTLDHTQLWVLDENEGDGDIYKLAEPLKTHRTEKTSRVIELSKATKEHPAQVEKETFDQIVGTWRKHYWSGAISASRKAGIIARLEELIRNVKKARRRANKTEVKKLSVGKKMLDFIMAE